MPKPTLESTFHAQLSQEGLAPTRWSNTAHAVYDVHEHPYGKVLMVVSGSITFMINSERAVTMKPGDRLELPPHTTHSAVVGPDGVVCLEAHLRAG